MKRLYSLAAMVAMGVSAIFASADAQLPQAVKGTLTPVSAPAAKTITAKRSAHLLASEPINTEMAKPAATRMPIAKAASENSGWEYIGDATFNDGLLYGAYRNDIHVDEAKYTVKAYVNQDGENPVYRLEDIYPTWYLNLLVPQPLYKPTNGETSSVTISYYDEESVMATFDLNLTCIIDNSRFEVRHVHFGTLKDGVFHFEDGDFELYYNNVLSGYSLPFDIIVPEIPEPEETVWTPIGTAMYSDGILCSSDPNATASDPYEVAAYQHPTQKNVFKLENLYSEEYLQLYGYEAIDGKQSSVILSYDEEGRVTADFDLNLAWYGMPVTLEQKNTDIYIENEQYIDFMRESFDVCFEGLSYWGTLEFEIMLPEITEPVEPIEPTEPEWIEIGDAMYSDGLLYAVYGANKASEPYAVKAYQSATDPNTYKLEDIYPTEYLEIEGIYAQTNGLKSSVILSHNELGDAFTMFELHITDTSDNTALVAMNSGYGKYMDGVFQFPEGTFNLYYNGEMLAYNLEFNIKLPGANDYSLEFNSFGGICNASKTFEFSISAGADAAGIKYGCFPGVFYSDEGNFEFVAQYGQDIEAGAYTYNMSEFEPGWYSFFVTTTTPQGNYAFGDLKYFYVQPDFVESEWNSLGSVSYTDDILTDQKTWNVELYENKETPGYFAVKDLYGAVQGIDNHGHSHYLYIDATNPDNVTIDLQPIGVNLGDIDDYSIQSLGSEGGQIKDGVLTFPVRGLGAFFSDLDGVYANRNGAFALQIPNLLTVTVTCDGTPVEGAFVNDANWEGEGAYTDAQGVAFLPAKFGQTEFVAYKDGYETVTFTPEANGRQLTATVALEAAQASFTVTVLDEDYELVTGAYVYFLDQELTTGENGSVKFTNLPAPELIGTTQPFSVYKDGYKYFEGEADFTETFDAFSLVTLQAEEASLTVIVLNSKEETVAGAKVEFNEQEYTTDEAGKVEITGISFPEVAGKTVPVTIIAEGYKDWTGEADFTETMNSYLVVTLENDPSAIGSVLIDLNDADTKVFDLNGRRVINPENGNVYIVNGLKVRINK